MNRINLSKVLVGMFVLLCLVCCEETTPAQLEGYRLENVVRVLMHKPGEFTILSELPETKELKIGTYAVTPVDKVRIFADVPLDQPMWVRLGQCYDGSPHTIMSIEIHLHFAGELNGAGWEEKQGNTTVQQQTTVLE